MDNNAMHAPDPIPAEIEQLVVPLRIIHQEERLDRAMAWCVAGILRQMGLISKR